MRASRTAFAGVLAAIVAVATIAEKAVAHLSGHGGPVRALAVSADGQAAISGGFDQSVIIWDINAEAARTVLRSHDGAVNAVAMLPLGGFATAGEDGRLAIFAREDTAPRQVYTAHEAPIVGLAVSPNGKEIASASWDATVRVQPLAGAVTRVLRGHRGNVNAVAYLDDKRVVSAGYDATVRIWPEDDAAPVIVALPAPVNAVAVLPGDRIAAGGGDGVVRIVGPTGSSVGAIEAGASPVTGLAVSPDGRELAVATIAGDIVVADWAARKIMRRIGGTGTPVWAVAFRAGGELLSGGGDRLIRRYDRATGEPIGAPAPAAAAEGVPAGSRGAELFRACSACHTLAGGGENRAGPSLHGVFGRRIATLSGYKFSEALQRLDIVWNAETIGRLFEIGPSRYTPGTKMPEQIIADPADRQALTRFLEQATR